MVRIAIVGLALLVAVPALAGAPATGTYYSSDWHSGTFDPGRFSESWVGGPGQIGNTINAMSWDGSTLGGDWVVSCPAIVSPPTLISDTRDASGTGDVKYATMYGGGTFWFSMNGPWGDGTEDYTGMINTFDVTTTYQYYNNTLLGIVSNITMSGVFDGYDSCIEYAIGNAAFVGDSGPVAMNYPPYLNSSCSTGPTIGGWGDTVQITLNIFGNCTVPLEEKTWGGIKALYE